MGMERIRREHIEGAKKLLDDFLKDERSHVQLPSSEAVKKTARAALAAGALVSSMPATAEGADIQIKPYVERQEKKEVLSKDDIEFLAQNIWHEAGGEPPIGQVAVAQVTLARLLSGRFGKTLTDVVFSPKQFSWTNDPKILMRKTDDISKRDRQNLADIRSALTKHMLGRPAADILKELAHITGLPLDTHYYKRTDWNEHDPDEKRMSEKGKANWRTLELKKVIGDHGFYVKGKQLPKER